MKNRLLFGDSVATSRSSAPFRRVLHVKILLGRSEWLTVSVSRQAYDPSEFDDGLAADGASARDERTRHIGQAAISEHPGHDFRFCHLLVVAKLVEVIIERVDAICGIHFRSRREWLLSLLEQRHEMFDEDVFEHVAADCVNYGAAAVLVYDVHHAGLLLVTFGALVVEIMQIKSDSSADGN